MDSMTFFTIEFETGLEGKKDVMQSINQQAAWWCNALQLP